MREFFTTGCVSFRTESSKEISEASLGESAPRKMRKPGKSALAHAVACCGIAPSGARCRERNVAPRPAADAAGCKEIAAPRLPLRSRAERSLKVLQKLNYRPNCRAAPQCCLLKVQRHEKADMAFQVLYYFTTNKKRQSHVRIKYYIKHNSD